MVAVGLISQELSKKLSRAKLENLAQENQSNLERTNEVESEEEISDGIATRRYELMEDEFDDQFMSRWVHICLNNWQGRICDILTWRDMTWQ